MERESSKRTIARTSLALAQPSFVAAAPRVSDPGFVLLRQAVSGSLLAQAVGAFEAGFLPSSAWPVPRGADWRHAQVDLDPAVLAICHLPDLLLLVGHIIASPFALMQVEGRDPCPGNVAQTLHRDIAADDPRCAVVLIFLDDFGPDNGATQLVPGSHRAGQSGGDHPICVAGKAGDILIMDGQLLHGATVNQSGRLRRSVLATYADVRLRDALAGTAALRGIRMPPAQTFLP